jgi:hypothetical protein
MNARAAATIERLSLGNRVSHGASGDVIDAARIEMPRCDLHEAGGLPGRLLDAEEARAGVVAAVVV